jgi:hypothetical protein
MANPRAGGGKHTGLVFLIVAGMAAGFQAGRAGVPAASTSRTLAEPGISAAHVAKETPSPAVSAALSEPSRSPASVAVASTDAHDALIKERGLELKSAALKSTFAGGEAGAHLARLSTFLEFQTLSQSPEGQLFSEHLTWLREHPDAAFQGIRQGLPHLDREYTEERRFLLQFAAKLDVPEAAKFEMLAGELVRPVAGEQTFDGAAALSALLETSSDPVEVESTLRRALQSQKDARTRDLYLSMYSTQEPDRARRLTEEFSAPH